MRHIFLALTLFAALLGGVPVSGAEPDRITQSLTVADYQPLDQPITVGTGTIEVRLKTSLTCTPPVGRVGCGVIVAAILHAPVIDPTDPETFPLYADVLDQTSAMICNGEAAIGCQQEGPVGEFVYTFNVPRPGRYVLQTISKVGFDYPSPDIRLTTDHPVTVGSEIYPDIGVIYEITGYANIDVYELRTV